MFDTEWLWIFFTKNVGTRGSRQKKFRGFSEKKEGFREFYRSRGRSLDLHKVVEKSCSELIKEREWSETGEDKPIEMGDNCG